jgi:mRNA-degrading endonuclease RelE of RelBE toxin-antitoxin system
MSDDFLEIVRVPGFARDMKRLLKRFRTLEEDLRVFLSAQLALYHKQGIDNGGIFPLQHARGFFKARRFACRSLKGRGGNSGIRVIYHYDSENDRLTLIELYFKGDKENEDRERVNRFLSNK